MTPDARLMTVPLTRGTPRTQPTVGVGFLRGLFEFALAEGADRAELLGRLGFDPGDLTDPDARAPFDAYVRLMRAARELTGVPTLALRYGTKVAIARVSVVGHVGSGVRTFAEGLAALNRYVRLIVEADVPAGRDRFEFQRRGDWVWVVDTRRSPNAFPELTESAFAQIIWSARRAAGVSGGMVHRVEFTHAPFDDSAEYERILCAPVAFAARRNAFAIDPALADQPFPGSDPYVGGVMRAHADGLLRRLDAGRSVVSQVESVVEEGLASGGASLARAARRLGVSEQTLRRRLQKEGASFTTIVDTLRWRLADQHLAGGRSVSETSWLLGFSDPSAFSRAYLRWTGHRPVNHPARRSGEADEDQFSPRM